MSGESRYKMHYVSGGGTQYDGGTWEIKQTAKTYKFTKIKDSFYSSHTCLSVRLKKEAETNTQ